jgi:hypothetical protein
MVQSNDLEGHKKSGELKNTPQLPFTYVYSYAPNFR